MSVRAVHWHEGMFLRPHQLQAAQRYLLHINQLAAKWDLHYNWGLRSIEIDREALSNHRLVIRRLEARLRDGTLIAIPEDTALPALDLKPALQDSPTVMASLALPVLRIGRANVAAPGSAEGGRYQVESQEIEDENTGQNPQPVQIRIPNVRLLLSTQDMAGYETLPIARIEKSMAADTAPQIDGSYIPPVVACDASASLLVDILQTVYDRIGRKIELLAGQVVSRGIAVESHAAADALIITQLRALNESYALLGILAFAQGVHPLDAYVELCRLVGQLSIFGDTHRPPELPKYDHDDLGGCFYQVKKYLDALLDKIIEPEYKQRPFEGAGLRMQVPLEPAWLEPAWQIYVGVKSPLTADECVKLLTKSGQLDMKIGSSDRVDRIYQLGQAGLKFTHSPTPPRALPVIKDLIYFQVSRESQQEEWLNVQKSLTLAIRLNETRIAGNIQGQRILTIRTGGQTTTLEFTLFVVKAGG
jgi:type VI secretion system protein ImpJ